MLGHAGTLVYIGLPKPDAVARFELSPFFNKRTRILVSHGGDHVAQEDFPRLAQWAVEGKLDLAGMVTRTAPLDSWDEALQAMRGGDVIRTVLTP